MKVFIIRLFLFSCFAFFGMHLVYAQEIKSKYVASGDSLHGLGDFSGALDKFYIGKADALTTEDYYNYFYSSGMVLECLHKMSEIRNLMSEHRNLEDDLTNYGDKLEPSRVRSWGQMSDLFAYLIYNSQGDSESALKVLLPILNSINSSPDITINYASNVYKIKVLIYISEAYLAQGNFEQTQYYVNETLIEIANLPPVDTQEGMSLKPHYILAQSYVLQGRTQEAIQELNVILREIPQLSQRHNERSITAYSTLLRLHLKNNNLDSAEYFLNLLKPFDDKSSHTLLIGQLEGEMYYAFGEYEKARLAFENNSVLLQNISANNSEDLAICNLQLGKIAYKQERYQPALDLLQNALLNFTENGIGSNPLVTPNQTKIFSHIAPVEILYYKSKVLSELYAKEERIEYLKSAWRTSQVGVEFVERVRKSYHNNEDKAFLIEQSYRTFEQALLVCNTQYHLEQDPTWIDSAFTLMERSKALNLMDAVLQENARKFAGIPDSLLAIELALRTEISGLKEIINTKKQSADSEVAELQQQVSNLVIKETQYQELLNKIETEHPEYYKLRHGNSQISLIQIQQILDENETVVEYFTGTKDIYILLIEENTKQLFIQHGINHIDALVEDYRASIHASVNDQGNAQFDSLYLNSASSIFDSILSPLLPIKSSLIIVPDGALHYVSFAGLLTSAPDQYYDYRTQPYLLWDHDVAYCYSMSLYRELHQKPKTKTSHSIIFAPDFDNNQSAAQLTFNREEAIHVTEHTNGTSILGFECTTETVRETLRDQSRYRIVHFATHGYADIGNGSDSYLAFAGKEGANKLYARELYDFSLDADLVYLSACETGDGQLKRGEGVISLARAFFFAGTRSLVTALWVIGDEPARDLTFAFYDDVMRGESISHSIANAQRHYLVNIPNEERYLAHPSNWSALVPIGSAQAILSHSKFWWWIFACSLFVVIGFIVFFKKNPSKG